MLEALGWGLLAVSSLALGALIGAVRPWRDAVVGMVLALGAGALISAVSFELAAEGLRTGGLEDVALGLAVGALLFFFADGAIERFAQHRSSRGGGEADTGAGPALALGAFLDGLPENLILGIGLAKSGGVSIALLVAIFVSNMPEAMGSASELRRAGLEPKQVVVGWTAVAVTTAVGSPVGFVLADSIGTDLLGVFNGFAAGALIVLLADDMVPAASGKAGPVAGLFTTLGFATGVALTSLD